MRNNEKRLGLAPDTPSGAADATAAAAPLTFVVPTEFVELPSQGKFYPEGHPLHDEDTIEIKFMTAKEEDILTSTALIKKGVVLERLISNLLIDKKIKSSSLLMGDRNAIIVAARISAYGSEYDTTATCPDCSKESSNSYDLQQIEHTSNCLDPDFLNQENIVYDTENYIFNIVLPKSQVTVGTKLMTGRSDRHTNAQKQEEASVTELLKTIIVSVNDNSDKTLINNFVDSMPAMDSKYLRRLYAKLVPNIDMKQEFLCVYCGHVSDMEVPFTAAFFWPE